MTEKQVFGACPHDCPDTCSMVTTVKDGRATEVRGNPNHPFTKGGLCVKVNNYQDRVYSADRVLHPLRRTGAKALENSSASVGTKRLMLSKGGGRLLLIKMGRTRSYRIAIWAPKAS